MITGERKISDRLKKSAGFLLCMFIAALFCSTAVYGGSKTSGLDGIIMNVTSRKITLKSGEELKVSPNVTTKNRFGKNIRFKASKIQSWEKLRVLMSQVEGEMVIVEIIELAESN
ncbi:MAG: hypothetical protein OEV42_17200 [Deltaproteobacteria bacterium]|nr:hypothetical protein [Deltaproteobacteria bacterium]